MSGKSGSESDRDGMSRDDRRDTAPSPGRDDSVWMEILLSHALLPVGEPGVFWALVTLTGVRANRAAKKRRGRGACPSTSAWFSTAVDQSSV